ncbi:hypothetical protein GALMADRAFT_258062 [Galerina marginata CBS 339.88]|uniref:Hydrophobin n=1 Tax=Galerina marginata (strain CBS 339.88) TaxID=685588 RepID=A0A067S9C5_GALM3|nr:hypothetical protein GALMADRAFT_258062 [Galerina marginata CBS 339.88]
MSVVGSTSTAFTVAATSSAYPVSSTFEFTNTIPNNFQPTVVRNVAFMPGIPPVLITNALPPLLAASQCHTGGGVQCCKLLLNCGRGN